MTKQITVKLNHHRYRPILDAMSSVTETDSELVAHCVFYCYACKTHKLSNGKTILENAAEIENKTPEEFLLFCLKKFKDFVTDSHH